MLVHLVEHARRYGRPLSLLVIDADHFKAVNDTHGHDIGDEVLVHIARLIEHSCRSTELLARWGGEEFVVIAPESANEAAVRLAERIRERVESTPLRLPEHKIAVTVSVGVAEYIPGQSPEVFFRRADQNLLRAKTHGRNRVVSEAPGDE